VHFPKLIERNAELRFLLRCQSYIELVREGKLLEAVAYARAQLAPYREAAPLLPPMYRDLLPEVISLYLPVSPYISLYLSLSPPRPAPRGGRAPPNPDPGPGPGPDPDPGPGPDPDPDPDPNQVVALIAYPDPAAAGPSQARLMGREQREKVAELLNGTVLRELGLDPACALERLLRQLVATHAAIRDANHGCGEGFRLLGEAAARPVASTPAID